jgi:adenine-specific DNA-methyltransferase
MPTLNWIGKEAVVNHDKEVPFRLLKKVKAHSVGDSQNLIIKGDNLEGLKAIMPYYVGKIKSIYIDPPYNTGNESWVYNDKVNSPKIKKWFNKVVNRDDLCKHDKWLCMMYPRLKLLYDLLDNNGIMFVSMDDNEIDNLSFLAKEIFGENNVEIMIWHQTSTILGAGSGTLRYSPRFRNEHEYILVCYKDRNNFQFKKVLKLSKLKLEYDNPDNDPRGEWISADSCKGERRSNPNGKNYYTYKTPKGTEYTRQWHFSFEQMKEFEKDNRLYFGKNGTALPRLKKFVNEKRPVTQISIINDVGSNTDGKQDLKEIFNEIIFDYPKPKELIKRFLYLSTNKDSIILDSFAGSGTTGHAVLDLNKEDGGNRKFILIEMEDDIAKKITAERIKKAIEKYNYKDGFEYCELDKPLFDENGQIEETCDFNQFATYVYFTETQTNIDKKQIDKNFIGEKGEVEYYLVYKEKYKNVLDKKFLSKLRKTKNKKIIYADFCMVDDDTLEKFNIQFKQIPYEVKIY